MSGARLGVAVIGCGLVGARRCRTAASHPECELKLVVDADAARARSVAADTGAAANQDWRSAVGRADIGAVAVCTPNSHLVPIAVAALDAGKHVLIEKPMGRNYAEAQRLAAAARRSQGVLKIGFNHRYHAAVARALECVQRGEIGRVLNIRARYGHGARRGCEREWRADPELAGGGELTDQGVHIVDLIHCVLGLPTHAVAFLQTAVWRVEPLEDNAFGMFRFANGAVAQFHASMTQWQNLFSFEIHGERGAVAVEGLGGSYGVERLLRTRRNGDGGAPARDEEQFAGHDPSWDLEWNDFLQATRSGAPMCGTVDDGLAAMRMIDALYRSASSGQIVEV